MKIYTILKNCFICLFVLSAACYISCNSKVVTHTNGSKALLPVLWIAKDTFHYWHLQHDTKIMFRFTYFSGRITLTGWAPTPNDSSDDYDSTHLLTLNPSLEKQIKLTNQKIYLGNLRLSEAEVNSLDTQLSNDSTAKYLVFIPTLDATYTQQVAYQIHLSSSTFSKDTLYTIDPKADPSPPATRK